VILILINLLAGRRSRAQMMMSGKPQQASSPAKAGDPVNTDAKMRVAGIALLPAAKQDERPPYFAIAFS